MAENSSNSSRGDGNTGYIPPAEQTKKQPAPRKHYCFTFNNYENSSSSSRVCDSLREIAKKFVFQEETGENGTPHLQGYVELTSKRRITELKKRLGDKIHWEVCRNIEDSIKYCQKDETRTGAVYKWGFPREVKTITNLRCWQAKIRDMLLEEPDDRTIVWIYDPVGCNGKTMLLKYLVVKYGCIFTSGGKNGDIINLIFNNKDYMTVNHNPIVLWNLPRTIEPSYISYNALESIKDGCISNNKFECSSFVCPNPHVVVFANCLPNFGSLTEDRWKVFTINDNDLVEYTDREEVIVE